MGVAKMYKRHRGKPSAGESPFISDISVYLSCWSCTHHHFGSYHFKKKIWVGWWPVEGETIKERRGERKKMGYGEMRGCGCVELGYHFLIESSNLGTTVSTSKERNLEPKLTPIWDNHFFLFCIWIFVFLPLFLSRTQLLTPTKLRECFSEIRLMIVNGGVNLGVVAGRGERRKKEMIWC